GFAFTKERHLPGKTDGRTKVVKVVWKNGLFAVWRFRSDEFQCRDLVRIAGRHRQSHAGRSDLLNALDAIQRGSQWSGACAAITVTAKEDIARREPVVEHTSARRSSDSEQSGTLADCRRGESLDEEWRTEVVPPQTQIHRQVLGGFPVILEKRITFVNGS